MPKKSYHRVDQLMPLDGTILITGPAKVGKTTLSLNLAASLITGKAFLNRYAVAPIAVDSQVGLINYDMSAGQYTRWMHEMKLPEDRLYVACMRASNDPLDALLYDHKMAERMMVCRVEVVIIDPVEGMQLQDYWQYLHPILRDIGVRDVVLIDSHPTTRVEDAADAIWTLERADYGNRRYFNVDGRDSRLEDTLLDFDPETRKLTIDDIASDDI